MKYIVLFLTFFNFHLSYSSEVGFYLDDNLANLLLEKKKGPPSRDLLSKFFYHGKDIEEFFWDSEGNAVYLKCSESLKTEVQAWLSQNSIKEFEIKIASADLQLIMAAIKSREKDSLLEELRENVSTTVKMADWDAKTETLFVICSERQAAVVTLHLEKLLKSVGRTVSIMAFEFRKKTIHDILDGEKE